MRIPKSLDSSSDFPWQLHVLPSGKMLIGWGVDGSTNVFLRKQWCSVIAFASLATSELGFDIFPALRSKPKFTLFTRDPVDGFLILVLIDLRLRVEHLTFLDARLVNLGY